MGLDYYSKNESAHLTLMEALHLILPRVLYGTGIPKGLTKAPWRVPKAHPRHADINGLLEYSTKVQMGHIPKTEFTDFILQLVSTWFPNAQRQALLEVMRRWM